MRRFIRSWINWGRKISKEKKGEAMDPGMKEFLEKYEEISQMEKNRDRNEYRTCRICKDASNLTKSQKRMAARSKYWADQAGEDTQGKRQPGE